MDEDILTGVEEQETPDAAGQEEETQEDLFGLEEETGEKEQAAAGPEDERVEQAFAKRLKAKEQQLRQELEEKIRREYEEKHRPREEYRPVYQHQPPPLPREELEKLADNLGLTPEATYALYQQQYYLNMQQQANQELMNRLARLDEERTKSEVRLIVEQQRSKNPNLPEFDEARLAEIRSDYQRRYGISMPWDAAYKQLVAEEAMSGNLLRKAEQETIANITGRQKATVQAGKAGQAKKPDIWDLPKEEFEKILERVKAGEFKKS